MALEKWHPLTELESMRREMDRILGEVFLGSRGSFIDLPWRRAGSGKAVASPAIDIVDGEKEVVVRADMPGVTRDDIEISLQERTLTIKGEVKAAKETKEENYYYSERSYNSYSRSIDIPFKIDQDKIKAGLKDGILTVTLPKAEEIRPKKIKVEVSQ